ncbi:MAG: HDOD domain-containing protein [Chromatiales bacterium]|jgi:HD-like signal output (HDOD) protein|nr:HDOD domain-containing protein [Chromatiales bacterium]MDX9766007.1 HDOD domain-containing protein [Ectothiorhodospiraceae bacterium]
MMKATDESRLQRLTPFAALSPEHRAQLARSARIEEVEAGFRIKAADRTAWLMFLLEGELGVVNQGRAALVTPDLERAHQPLFDGPAGDDFVVGKTPCRLLLVDREAFQQVLNSEQMAGIEVSDTEIDGQESLIFQDLYVACTENRLVLPPMPEVAMRIQQLARDPNVGVNELARVIQMDAAVTGALIHATNSPLYRGNKVITNVKDAVVRLGLKTTRTLASSIAMRQAFHARSPVVRARMQELWQHSVNVSAICYVLARRTPGFDAERGLLAGLMHDIGVVPILKYVEEHDLDLDPTQLESIIRKLHAMTGVLVLNYWKLDAELLVIAEEADDWQRDAGPQPDYCDLVIAAQVLSFLNTPRLRSLPPLQDIPALAKFGLGDLTPDADIPLLKEVEQEVAEIKLILNG